VMGVTSRFSKSSCHAFMIYPREDKSIPPTGFSHRPPDGMSDAFVGKKISSR
jgi:hypothetical protein